MTKVAYLVNQYPKTSHTFIRREIAGVEEAGVSVERFSIRRTTEPLPDENDRNESARTRSILSAGRGKLATAVASAGIASPLRLLGALRLTARIGWRSERGFLRHLAYLAEAAVLLEWIRDAECDHLHAHFGTNSATVAMLCHELGGPPFSFTVHGPEEFDKPDAISLSRKVEQASFVAAISNFGRSQLLRRMASRTWSKVHVVRCGVDQAFLNDDTTPVPIEPHFVCVGRLCEQKGQILLVEAAAELVRRGLPLTIALVGDGEMRQEITEAIARHGLEKVVTIVGWCDEKRVRQEIERARALVLPSFAEGLPVVIMEALALGRPVVSTFVAGIPELVEPGKSGFLVPAGSVSDLVQAMELILKMSPAELTTMGAHGRLRVRELHDATASGLALANLFRRGSAT